MLDVTGVQVAEHPELKHLVAQSARRIENALLLAQPHRLRLQLAWPSGWAVSSDAGEGLLCLDADGLVTGANPAARAMLPALGLPGPAQPLHAGDLFAQPWESLFDLARQGEAALVPLWSACACASALVWRTPRTPAQRPRRSPSARWQPPGRSSCWKPS